MPKTTAPKKVTVAKTTTPHKMTVLKTTKKTMSKTTKKTAPKTTKKTAPKTTKKTAPVAVLQTTLPKKVTMNGAITESVRTNIPEKKQNLILVRQEVILPIVLSSFQNIKPIRKYYVGVQ